MINKNSTFLITGGCGFIGSNFVHYLFKNYKEELIIINLDKLTYAGNLINLDDISNKSNYYFIKGDICNRELLEYIFDKFTPNYVVNFAAESHVDRSIDEPEIFIKTNVLGAYTLFDVSKEYIKNNRIDNFRFIQISTDEVYGSLPLDSKEKFNEESPLKPNSPYSASKASADLLAKSFFVTYGLPIIITRSSNNFGPRQYPEKLIPLTIKKALKGEQIPVYGDGQNIRDWIYVEDNCKAIDLVIHKGKIGEIYNIGGGNEWKNIDLVNLICEILGEISGKDANEYKKLITFVKDRPGHDKKYSLDISKIKKELYWQEIKPFKYRLFETIKWYLLQTFQ